MANYTNMYPGSMSQGFLRKSLAESFLWMTGGLLVTAVVSYFFYSTGLLMSLLYRMPMFSMILALIQFGLVIAFTAMMRTASASTMKVLFLVYSATMGISLSSVLYVFDFGDITIAFVVSAFYFLCLAVLGFTTKRDLSKLGTICLAALIALIISQVVMMLFRVNMDVRLYSAIGLLIFTGLTAWDMQNLKQTLAQPALQGDLRDKCVIYFALQLYLDFLNIFLYILQLIGAGSRSRN